MFTTKIKDYTDEKINTNPHNLLIYFFSLKVPELF